MTGAADLISNFKLVPHYEFFCKRSLPESILDTHYVYNVMGDTEIRKGDNLQLDQLIQNPSFSRDTAAHIQPFDLNILKEAFQLRETGSVELPPVRNLCFELHFAVIYLFYCFIYLINYWSRHLIDRPIRGLPPLLENQKMSLKTRRKSTRSIRTGTRSIRSTSTGIKTEVKIKTRTKRKIRVGIMIPVLIMARNTMERLRNFSLLILFSHSEF